MFDRRLVTSFDWILLLTVIALAGIGILNLYSATANWHETSSPIYIKQFIWLCGGIAIAFGLVFIRLPAPALFCHSHLPSQRDFTGCC